MSEINLEIILNKVIEDFKSEFNLDPALSIEYVAFSVNKFMEYFNSIAESVKENNE